MDDKRAASPGGAAASRAYRLRNKLERGETLGATDAKWLETYEGSRRKRYAARAPARDEEPAGRPGAAGPARAIDPMALLPQARPELPPETEPAPAPPAAAPADAAGAGAPPPASPPPAGEAAEPVGEGAGPPPLEVPDRGREGEERAQADAEADAARGKARATAAAASRVVRRWNDENWRLGAFNWPDEVIDELLDPALAHIVENVAIVRAVAGPMTTPKAIAIVAGVGGAAGVANLRAKQRVARAKPVGKAEPAGEEQPAEQPAGEEQQQPAAARPALERPGGDDDPEW